MLRRWDSIHGHRHGWRDGGRPDTGERPYWLILWCCRNWGKVAKPDRLFWRIQLDLGGRDMLLKWWPYWSYDRIMSVLSIERDRANGCDERRGEKRGRGQV